MIPADEYAALGEIIRDRYIRTGVDRLVIDASLMTDARSPLELFSSKTQVISNLGCSVGLFQTWLDLPWEEFTLQRRFEFELPYHLWTEEDVETVTDERGFYQWKLFYERFPRSCGRIFCGRVAHDPNTKSWLTHTGNATDGRGGAGFFHFYQGDLGGLQHKKSFMTWVS